MDYRWTHDCSLKVLKYVARIVLVCVCIFTATCTFIAFCSLLLKRPSILVLVSRVKMLYDGRSDSRKCPLSVLEEDRNIVCARTKGERAITMQASKTAIVIGHCPYTWTVNSGQPRGSGTDCRVPIDSLGM